MKIPKYWAKATAEESDPDGCKIAITCWRWADESQAQAEQAALAAVKRTVANLLHGRRLEQYHYGQHPLREEVLNQTLGSDGQPIWAVTRNRYGAIVLNTARAAFLDLDFPPRSVASSVLGLFSWVWGKPTEQPPHRPEREVLDRLERYVADHPSCGFRVYRTLAGIRALAISDLFEPDSPPMRKMFQALPCDRLYVRLCESQACFRARLTPKPWRCGCEPNRTPWPRDDSAAQAMFERWEAEYASRQRDYATCRLIGTIGNPQVHPQLEPIIQLHDMMTRCHDDLPLA
jgi:hypothetical protein